MDGELLVTNSRLSLPWMGQYRSEDVDATYQVLDVNTVKASFDVTDPQREVIRQCLSHYTQNMMVCLNLRKVFNLVIRCGGLM